MRCSHLTVVGPRVYVGVVLFFAMLNSYLVYPSFLLLCVVWTMSLMISLLGATGFKVQMVAPHDVVRATVPVTLEVTWCSQRLFSATRVCSVILEVFFACSHGGRWLFLLFLRSLASGQVPQISLTAPLVGTLMYLLLWRPLPQACFRTVSRLRTL